MNKRMPRNEWGTVKMILQSRYRRLATGWRVISIALTSAAVILTVLYIFNLRPFGFVMLDISYYYVLVALFLPLVFLWNPITRKAVRDRVPWYDALLVSLSFAIPAYYAVETRSIMLLAWDIDAPPIPFALSLVLWVLLVEAARRSAGPIFAAVVLFFSTYPLFASNLGGILWAPNFSLHFLSSFHSFSSESIRGLVLRITGDLVLGYMVFATVIQMLGAGDLFGDLASVFVGKTRASNVKVAIISSGLFGSISGDPNSNVMTTGIFTIPAMKREGIPSYFAGAVEACASSGGPLMPPVMGVVAFIMAEFIGVPYVEVCIAAVVPALLYFGCLFAQADAFAARTGLQRQPQQVKAPPVLRILTNQFHLIMGGIVLVLILFLFRLSSQAPWIALGLIIVMAMLRRSTRIDLGGFIRLLEQIGRIMGEIMGILAPIGLIIGSFIISGLAFALPYEMIKLAGGNVYVMLVIGAVAGTILGMGLTISAVYIFLAIVLAPGLVAAGLDLVASHLFVLYVGMLSSITPPVAITAFIAASIAEANPMKTGFQAMKLGVAKYILPFVFILSPALILRGPLSEILWVIPSVAVGLGIISGALEGYMWRLGTLTIVSRTLFLGAGILTLVPNLGTTLLGMGALVILSSSVYLMRQKKNKLARIMIKNIG